LNIFKWLVPKTTGDETGIMDPDKMPQKTSGRQGVKKLVAVCLFIN